jgi:hypothetical protein
MSTPDPFPPPIIPIVDPIPNSGLIDLAIALAPFYFMVMLIAIIIYLVAVTDYKLDHLLQMTVRIGVVVALIALPSYYYPGFHGWYFSTVAGGVGVNEWSLALTKYNPERWGGVHIPSAIYVMVLVLAITISGKVANTIAGIGPAVGRLADKIDSTIEEPADAW